MAADDISVLKKDDVVLFQGDSITDAGRTASFDPDRSLGEGFVFLVAKEIGQALPERKVKVVNRGISGNRITDLAARWRADALDLKPSLLSILIGVNDALSTTRDRVSPEMFEQVYDKLISETEAARPGIRIVLCEPFLLASWADPTGYADASREVRKRQEAVARIAAKYQLTLIRFQEMFDDASRSAPPSHWSEDGVHPTAAGHQLMAAKWLETIRSLKN